ncbi:sensor histidine kinase [Streptomyces sp. NPDC057757]|uniref:sensor histidine kinase n=1 Tax=Streptomyces sp. NPDC057757 TaxID=3346241 RepID=UPI0036B79ABA
MARWNALGVLVRDGVFTLALTPLVFAPATTHLSAEFGDLAKRSPDLPGVLVTLALWLPLVVRRRWPGVCLALVAAAFAVHQLGAFPATFASVGLYVALYSVGAHGRRVDGPRLVLVSAAAIGLFALFALGLHHRGSPQRASDFLLILLVLVCCWAAGRAVQARQAGEEERRRLSVAAATAQERARIARELHDVVTHHVTAMTVQADAALFLLADAPDRVATGLGAIGDSGRHALADLRQLLGVLQASGGDPSAEELPADTSAAERVLAPGRLGELVERTRAAGQPVELTRTGERPAMASGVELAAYRVVQEGLTNALKHAPGHRTLVTVRYAHDEIEVAVTTEGAPAVPAATGTGPLGRGGGLGLVGLRERVAVFGGELLAGARPDGGFTVSARIPAGDDGVRLGGRPTPAGERAIPARRHA